MKDILRLDRKNIGASAVIGYGAAVSELKPVLVGKGRNKKGGLEKVLTLPLEGSMSSFEQALFADADYLRFVQVVLTTNSIAPWSVAADYSLQFLSFIDMVNDIRGSSDIESYLLGFKDIVSDLGKSWVSSKAEDISLGFTLIFDPMDAVLPVSFTDNQSMSTLSNLNYKVSVDRIKKLSSKYTIEGGNLIINFVV